MPNKKIATKKISATVTFKATPGEVYDALMDSKKHTKFSGGARAKMSTKEGGAFSAYDGYIEGNNLKLIIGKKIVQSWRASDWPAGHYSEVTFLLTKKGKGTELKFTQTGVPADQYKDIKQGWTDFYWSPMKALLENK